MTARTLSLLLVALLASDVPAADPKAKPAGKPNRLANESSPYLLQHAHNPVDWHPWGTDAFDRAKKEGKLIFLSIGYSSCHWCHVMERESFENAEVAKILNEHFVCVKVDREERPDIDEVYLTALQSTGLSGGWPLTMFLTPEGKPIFGGTYFPPDDKKIGDETQTGMKSILARVIELHRDKKKDLYDQADAVAERTAEMLARPPGRPIAPLDAAVVQRAADDFDIDPEHGGFGRAERKYVGTKFPRVAALQFLLHQAQKPKREELAKRVTLTLDRMAEGGIYDHLGGGFHRYSTERTWTVPHFEKMLYDQAQLVEVYADAVWLKPNPAYRRVIDETLALVKRELTAPDGYFYSALDADSDGEEGKFYVWTAKELETVIGTKDRLDLFRRYYSAEKSNFEEKYHILRTGASLAAFAKVEKKSEADILSELAAAKRDLMKVRDKRNRPFLDTKLIVAWNGQMIAAYALAGQASNNTAYLTAAETAADFILKTLRDKDGKLLRLYAAKPGDKPTARGTAFLDDYAYLIHGLLTLHDATLQPKWLDAARQLQAEQEKRFADTAGGYFNAPSDGEKLFARGKDSYDGAQPSANGGSARNLLRLWQKTKADSYRDRCVKCVTAAGVTLTAQPTSVPILAGVLDQLLTAGAMPDAKVVAPAEKPAAPKTSADVIAASLDLGPIADGEQTVTVVLHVQKGWHIYANPVTNDTLAESVTTVAFDIDGKKVTAKVSYPAGTERKDATAGSYRTYTGEVRIEAKLTRADIATGKLTARVRLIACNDKTCLAPATVTIK